MTRSRSTASNQPDDAGDRAQLRRAQRAGAGARAASPARVAAGELAPDDDRRGEIEAALDTADLPPLDLLIRTSGEHRLSNFLLWQAAYAELLFVDTLWPDFDGDALRAALAEFARRANGATAACDATMTEEPASSPSPTCRRASSPAW